MPVSIAPQAVAEQLDEGWGDDAEPSANLAPEPVRPALVLGRDPSLVPARVPRFDAAPAARTPGATRSTSDAREGHAFTVAAAVESAQTHDTRKRSMVKRNVTLTGGFMALPRATATRDVAAASPEVPNEEARTDASDAAAVSTYDTIAITSDASGAAPSALVTPSVAPKSPVSAPPELANDSDWDVPSEASTPPAIALEARQVGTGAASSSPARTSTAAPTKAIRAEGTKAPRHLLAVKGTRESDAKSAAVSAQPPRTAPSVRAIAVGESKRTAASALARGPSEAPRLEAVPKGAGEPPASTPTPVAPTTSDARHGASLTSDARHGAPPTSDSRHGAADVTVEPPSLPNLGESTPIIDITIPPSFSGSAEPALNAPAATMPSDRETRVRSEPPARLRAIEPVTSMSPVTAAPEPRRGGSRPWLWLAASLVAGAAIWTVTEVRSGARSEAKRAPANVVVAAKPSAIVAVVPATADPVPPPAAIPAAPEPPATDAPANAAETAKELPASPATTAADQPQKKPRARVTQRAQVRAERTATSTEPPADGASTPSLNAPVTPAGIVDPKAFPTSDGAAKAAKVQVEVDPPDSKIAVRGQVATAPYAFDIPKGARLVLEVAHPGYITRRIVLDGSRETVRISMIPEPKAATSEEVTPRNENTPDEP